MRFLAFILAFFARYYLFCIYFYTSENSVDGEPCGRILVCNYIIATYIRLDLDCKRDI